MDSKEQTPIEDLSPMQDLLRQDLINKLKNRPIPDNRNVQNRVEGGMPMTKTDRLFQKLRSKSLNRYQVVRVQHILRAKPDQWRLVGDLAKEARIAAVEGNYGHTTIQGLSVLQGIEELRQKLTLPNSNELEKLLIEQIITCWVQCGATAVKLEEVDCILNMNVEGRFWENRHQNAHARLIRSIESLAKLRGLGLQIVSASENTVINVIGTHNQCSSASIQSEDGPIVSRQ